MPRFTVWPTNFSLLKAGGLPQPSRHGRRQSRIPVGIRTEKNVQPSRMKQRRSYCNVEMSTSPTTGRIPAYAISNYESAYFMAVAQLAQ